MKSILTLSAALLLAACSSLPSRAPSASLIPDPVSIPGETQDQIPGIVQTLRQPGETVTLTRPQAQALATLLVVMFQDRENLRDARRILAE